MAKKVSVTSVTPASKVKATSKAQQARTRGLVMGIATATPAGRAVKAAATVAKAAKTTTAASATARALKAAQGKSLASPVKKAVAKKNAKERLVTQNLAKSNIKVFKQLPKYAYGNAAKTADEITGLRNTKFAKKSPNTYNTKTMKNVKPMENVPKDVSDRFKATVKKLAAEEAKKKKK